jgi:hypothetical protein
MSVKKYIMDAQAIEDKIELRREFLKTIKTRKRFDTTISTKIRSCTVEEFLNTGFRPQRAGVIPIVSWNGENYFGMGIDTKYRDLTDFGGAVELSTDENAIAGALREFYEESLGVFGRITVSQVMKSRVIYNGYMLILFLRVEEDPKLFCDLFDDAIRQKCIGKSCEVCGIMFFTYNTLYHKIHHSREIFDRVGRFLSTAGEFWRVI